MKIDPDHKTITEERPAEKHALRAAFEGTMPKEFRYVNCRLPWEKPRSDL